MADLAKIVDDLSSLTVLEAAELAKLLEEKWGVSAAAAVAVAAGPAGAAAPAVEEQTEFTVVLAAIGGVIYCGPASFWRGLALAIAMYFARMTIVTAAYHRYFSHRSFKTSRWFQFVLALGAQSSAQKGVLWWASHHRWHHKYSDEQPDVHSARLAIPATAPRATASATTSATANRRRIATPYRGYEAIAGLTMPRTPRRMLSGAAR